MLSRFCALALFLLGTHAGATPPELYAYPPPAIYPPGYKIWSPVTLRADQITTQFPDIPQLRGVGLIIYWNTICPRENEYDFSIIDQALSYWGARGKKVVLCVGTVGFPIRLPDGSLMSATPDWVLKKVATYQQDINVLPWTPDKTKSRALTTLPSYWDPVFAEETRKLAIKLAERYDGNSALSKIRISLGILGEDNATFDAMKAAMPGFTKSAWIDYCSRMTDIYAAAFHKTPIEFDEGWTSLIEVYGNPAEQAKARALMESLFARKIFIAFNGLDSEDITMWENRHSPTATQWHKTIAQDLMNLQEAKSRGCGIGLEAIGPLMGAENKDIPAIAKIVQTLQPDRLLLFDDVPMLLRDPPDANVGEEVPPTLVDPMRANAKALVQALGLQ